MNPNLAQEFLRRQLAQIPLVLPPDTDSIKGGFNIGRLLHALRNEKKPSYNCPELELSEALESDARRRKSQPGMDRTPTLSTGNSAWLPYSELLATRADIVGTTTLGGYLVSTVNAPAAPALGAMTVIGRAGTNIITGLTSNLSIPKVTTTATSTNNALETTQATESDQAFGQVSMTPRTFSAYTEISRLLDLQSSANLVVSNDLRNVIFRKLDAECLQGTGNSGDILGLTHIPGIGTFSGTAASLASLSAAALATGDALSIASSPCWLGNRTVANTLRGRIELANVARTLWDGNMVAGSIAGFPAYSTSGISSGNLYFGNWAYAVLGLWGPGVEIAVNPVANFQSGVIGIRCMVSADFAVMWPTAFAINSSAVT